MSVEQLTQYLSNHGEKKLAIQLLEALAKHAFHFEEYDDVSKCAFKLKAYPLAIKNGENALIVAYTNEKMWVARANLINVYNHANHPEKALRLIKANEAIMPEDADTRLEKAFSYYLMGRRDEAETILRKELERDDLTEEVKNKIMFNLGTYELYRDNLQKGLELFLLDGQKLNIWKKPKLSGEFWTGQEVPKGTPILVYAEAGIGDEIINIRFLRHLEERGMKPVWYTDRKDIANIFKESGFDVITDITKRPRGSIWTHSMTVPTYLKLDQKDLWYGPYIKSIPSSDEKWQKILDMAGKRLKIGLRWQGNPEYDEDLHRSIPLAELVAVIPNHVKLISLQRDTGLEELKEFPYITDLSQQLTTFEDAVAAINCMDIIITSCTSITHAAAALGKRVFVIVPLSAYYVWSHSTKQSPWYGDNVTVLRQVKPRSWYEPIQELRQLLVKLCA